MIKICFSSKLHRGTLRYLIQMKSRQRPIGIPGTEPGIRINYHSELRFEQTIPQRDQFSRRRQLGAVKQQILAPKFYKLAKKALYSDVWNQTRKIKSSRRPAVSSGREAKPLLALALSTTS